MSGGYFDYIQYNLEDLVGELKRLEESKGGEEWRDPFSTEVAEMIGYTRVLTELACIHLNRLDWYLSGDDGEDNMFKRLREDLEEMENGIKK